MPPARVSALPRKPARRSISQAWGATVAGAPTSSRKEKAAKEGSHRRAADVLRVLAALAEPAGRHATPLGHRRHARASDRHSPRHPPHRGALQLQSMRSARDAQLHCNRVWKPHLPTSRPLQLLSSEKLAAWLVAIQSRGPTRDLFVSRRTCSFMNESHYALF